MPSTKKLKRRIGLLTATVEQLLIDNAQAERDKKLAEVRAREAQNRLDTVRARVTQADRAALLDHDGAGWPEEVVDALARSLYGWPKPFEVEGFMRFKVRVALDAAALAHRRATARANLARALKVIVGARAVCERLLEGAGHDAVGTTEDGAS